MKQCIFVLVFGVAFTKAFICPEDFCKSVKCDDVEPNSNNCPGSLIPNSSTCGCCSTCQIEKEIGEPCSYISLILKTSPWYIEICKPGSICVNNICETAKENSDDAS